MKPKHSTEPNVLAVAFAQGDDAPAQSLDELRRDRIVYDDDALHRAPRWAGNMIVTSEP